MSTDLDPKIGQWYSHSDKGQQFEVIALDEDEGVVEIQHFDGTIEELDLDGWYKLEIESIEPPEDWTGPVDSIERDDLGYSDDDEMKPEDWTAPLGEFNAETETERKQRLRDAERPDDWSEGFPAEEPYEEE